MTTRRDAFSFYLGIMVGVIGNFLVSSIFEFSKAILEKANWNILFYWAIMFIVSSIAFFQTTKLAMGRFEIPPSLPQAFNIATVICIVLGIIPLVIFFYEFAMFEFFDGWTIYQILTFILLVITSLFSVSLGLKKLYNWSKWGKERKEYDRIMEDPLDVHFFIPRSEVYRITYEKQDNRVHEKDELEIPKGVESTIFLRIKPRIDVKVGDRYFGFKIGETRKKPEISYSEAFIRQISFEKEVFKDWYGHLHFPKERFWRKGEIYVCPLKIKTYDTGDYTFHTTFHLSCYEYKSIKEERHTVARKMLKIKVTENDIPPNSV